MLDPESTPPRNPYNQSYASAGMMDNPWYTGGGQPSPQGSHQPAPAFNSYYPSTQQASSFPYTPSTAVGQYEENYDDEPPLLEELGIRFDHIWNKTQAVIYPQKQISAHILDDTDLAGPLFYCLLLGSFLLLAGKVHFGYIYGFSVCGCLGLQGIISLMHPIGLDFWRTASVLGYCLLPVILLAFLSIGLRLNGIFGLLMSIFSIAWSTFSATRFLDAKLNLTEQYWLLAYPIMLLYSCFVIITIF